MIISPYLREKLRRVREDPTGALARFVMKRGRTFGKSNDHELLRGGLLRLTDSTKELVVGCHGRQS